VPGPSPATADPPAADMPAPGRSSLAGDDGDDEFMAGLLIRMWALASGRTLRSDIRPEQLSGEELIRFWADDLTPPPGRHAGPAAGTVRAAR
jgi:hypothetical protein